MSPQRRTILARWSFLIFLGGTFSDSIGLSAPLPKEMSPDQILQRADEIRSPSGSFKMKVSLETPGEDPYQYEIHIGGKDTSMIRSLIPKREVGKNFLMVQSDMWAYIPNLRRAVRVTLNQKLTGQAVNGDIGRMRWHGDYQAVIESQTADHWVLFLKALRKDLTYDQIRLWVAKKDFRPIKGEYLTQTGKPLKRISFREFRPMAGELRPVDMLIENAQKSDEKSILRILEMEAATFPAQHFTQSNLQ
jgi:outer membrane lipoprotein-sorting protein